jgi:tetratricopeptide (TPR) repeat protein
MLEGALPEKYGMMIEAEKFLAEGRYGEAASLYAGLARSYPDAAGLHFSHAVALGFLDKGDECRDAMVRAYGIDAVYMKGFFQLARVLGANGRLSAGEALLETPDLSKTLSRDEMDYQRALFYMQAGLYQQAVEMLVDVTAKRPKDFAARTILYHAYEELGEEQNMYRVLDGLVRLDRDRVKRDMPWAFKKLGDIAWNVHMDPVAAGWYKHYLELVPGDPDAAKMLGLIEKWEGVDTRPTPVE